MREISEWKKCIYALRLGTSYMVLGKLMRLWIGGFCSGETIEGIDKNIDYLQMAKDALLGSKKISVLPIIRQVI